MATATAATSHMWICTAWDGGDKGVFQNRILQHVVQNLKTAEVRTKDFERLPKLLELGLSMALLLVRPSGPLVWVVDQWMYTLV